MSEQKSKGASGSSKTRSPDSPSRNLEDCFADVRTAYEQYSHGNFSMAELASALQVSAGTGAFRQRLFSLKAFGLLAAAGENFKASDLFKKMLGHAQQDPEFKRAALEAAGKPKVFSELLEEFPHKLPNREALASRLELQKNFTKERAGSVARVFEESLRFAGALDANNNIIPIRSTAGTSAGAPRDTAPYEEQRRETTREEELRLETKQMTLEISLGDGRQVTVSYPPDVSEAEATKVSKVLAAIVS
jgi:hypothetical protein